MVSVSGVGESFSLACLGDYPSEFFQALDSVSHSHWTDKKKKEKKEKKNLNVCIYYYMSIVIVIIFTLSY